MTFDIDINTEPFTDEGSNTAEVTEILADDCIGLTREEISQYLASVIGALYPLAVQESDDGYHVYRPLNN